MTERTSVGTLGGMARSYLGRDLDVPGSTAGKLVGFEIVRLVYGEKSRSAATRVELCAWRRWGASFTNPGTTAGKLVITSKMSGVHEGTVVPAAAVSTVGTSARGGQLSS